MKTRSPFLALVKFELSRLWHQFGTSGYVMWVLGFLWTLRPAASLIRGLWSMSPEYADLFSAKMRVWAGGWMFGWLFLMGFHYSFELVRDARSVFPFSTLPNDNSDEFFGTRAVSPRIRFRAKTIAMAAVIVAPLLLNAVVSLVGTGSILVQRDRMLALPLILVPVAAITLVQAYYGLISKCFVKRSRRLAAFAAALVPAASLVASPLFVGSFNELFQKAFPFFAEYWLPLTLALGLLAVLVQRFCERCFAEQEVL